MGGALQGAGNAADRIGTNAAAAWWIVGTEAKACIIVSNKQACGLPACASKLRAKQLDHAEERRHYVGCDSLAYFEVPKTWYVKLNLLNAQRLHDLHSKNCGPSPRSPPQKMPNLLIWQVKKNMEAAVEILLERKGHVGLKSRGPPSPDHWVIR
eukprot:719125-Pelagomonas_calceolata.AAC.2